MSEFTDGWPGPIEVVRRRDQILPAIQEGDENPVLLICGRNLSALMEQPGQDWEQLFAQVTVVLVESPDNMELVRTYFRQVDTVLLQGIHQGVAIDIVQSAKSGVRGFPAALVQQLLRQPKPPSRAGNGAAPPDAPDRPPQDTAIRAPTGTGRRWTFGSVVSWLRRALMRLGNG